MTTYLSAVRYTDALAPTHAQSIRGIPSTTTTPPEGPSGCFPTGGRATGAARELSPTVGIIHSLEIEIDSVGAQRQGRNTRAAACAFLSKPHATSMPRARSSGSSS